MAPLPAVAKVVRLDLHSIESSRSVCQNRLFFQYAGALSSADATTWLSNMNTAWGTFATARLNTDENLTLMVLTDLTSATAVQVQSAVQHAGGLALVPCQAGVALVIKKILSRRYRGGHPRFYLQGLSVNDLVQVNQWDPTQLGLIIGSFVTFINACTANTNPAAIGAITHVSVSYFHGFTNVTNPITGRARAVATARGTPLVDPVINITGNPIVGSQRRRNEQP